MQYDNNPFSKYLSDKKMFDWSYHMTAKQHDEYSLQRYKELFFFFVSCFNNGKTELLENDLFNESWGNNYGNTLGCHIFHLAVNCYLYYYGYREKNELVDNEKRTAAILFLKKILSKNTRYLMGLYSSNIKENNLHFFLQEAEIMPKDEIGKTMIMPDIIRDFLLFSTLISSCFQITDLSTFLKQNTNLAYYQCYITKEYDKREKFRDFLRIFYNDERLNADQLYDTIKKSLQKIFTERKLKESKEKLEKYKSQFSEEVLGNEYIKQIKDYLDKTFSPFILKEGKLYKLENVNLLDYQFLTDFVDKTFSQMSMDALVYNLISTITDFLVRNKLINEQKINTNNTKEYLDFLSEHSLDFVIGSHDVLVPHDYRNPELLERYEKDISHLYVLGWFRNILALNSKSISISVDNFKTEFSVPDFEEIKGDFIQEGDCFRKEDGAECYTREEFNFFIGNTYRNIKITAEMNVGIVDNKRAYLLIPTQDSL